MQNKVILISIDGMRSDAMQTCGNPYVKELEKLCTYNYGSQAVLPSDTLPCHYSMTHAQIPEKHGVKTNTYVKPENGVPGIFEMVRQAGGTTGMFYNWEYLRDLAVPGSYTFSFCVNIDYDDLSDDVVTDHCLKAIDRYHPDFVMLYMLDLDEKGGHSNGWMSEEYLRRLSIALDNVKRTIAHCGQEYSIIITADHGGHDYTHGSAAPEDMTIPLFLYGPRFAPGKTMDNTSLIDIPPTAAAIMGIEPHPDWDGRSLVNQ